MLGNEPDGQFVVLNEISQDINRKPPLLTCIALDLALVAAHTRRVRPLPLLVERCRVDLDVVDIEHGDGQAGCVELDTRIKLPRFQSKYNSVSFTYLLHSGSWSPV